MVLTKLVDVAINIATKIGPKVIRADEILLKHAGWKPGAARGISHGIFSGTALANVINESGPNLDDAVQKKPNGATSNKPNQARSRQFSNSRRRYNSKYCNCSKHRYSNSRSFKQRRNR